MAEIDIEKVRKELKKEVDKTLMFFVECDLEIEGYISESTKELFAAQNRQFPEILEGFVKKG